MNEDTFNIEVRKFLKQVGVTSQREGPIPLEPELAHELEALAAAHTPLETVSERLAAGRPADRKS